MKKIISLILTVFTVAILFAAARPSLDGRAVICEEGEMPKGLFARTIGYLPGDSVSVTNPANGCAVDVLILGAVDASEGVAILLTPEAGERLGIKKNSNVQVKITKRTGSLDENASGTAVLSEEPDSADYGDGEELESEVPSAEESAGESGEETEDAENGGGSDGLSVEETPEESYEETEEIDESPAEEPFESENGSGDFEPEMTLPEEFVQEESVEESVSAPENTDAEEPVSADLFDETSEEENAEKFDDGQIPDAGEEPPEESVVSEELPAVSEEETAELAELDDLSGANEPSDAEVSEPVFEDADGGSVLTEETEKSEIVDDVVPAEPLEEEKLGDAVPEENAFSAGEDFNAEEFVDTGDIPEESAAVEDIETAAESELSSETEAAEKLEVSEEIEPLEKQALFEEVESVSEEETADGGEVYAPIILVPAEPNPPAENPFETDETVQTEENSAEESPADSEIAGNAFGADDEVSSVSIKEIAKNSFDELEKGAYYLQIATLEKEENIRAVLKKYSPKYPVELVRHSNGASYQILVGPLSADEYGMITERFRSYGFKDCFLRKIK